MPGDARRHDAGALLDALLAIAPDDTFRILGVTAAPLRAPEHEALIGYARRGGRALVYSIDSLSPMLVTEAAHQRFTRRIVAHELGHTHGGAHCEGQCVLSDVTDAASIDDQPDGYCPEHAAMVRRALAIGPDHPVAKVRLGAERLFRWARRDRLFRSARSRRLTLPHVLGTREEPVFVGIRRFATVGSGNG